MKKEILLSILLALVISISYPSYAQQQGAPYDTVPGNLIFTDTDGQTHNLYDLIDQGFRVILDFGFIGCGPCYAWSAYAGPELWDEYGPNGDNTLRMFYFEVTNHTDSYVDQYYTNIGVEYPIVNTDFDNIESQYQAYYDAGILENGFPIHVYVCEDRTYRKDIGYGNPYSLAIAEHILDNSCNGQDLHYKDVALLGLNRPFSYCSENSSTIEITPKLSVVHYGLIYYESGPDTIPPQSEYSINDIFFVKTYINNVYLRTDTLDPLDVGDAVSIGGDDTTQGEIGPGSEWQFFIPAIQVQINDSVKFEILYPEDSYMNNNTFAFKVTEEAETKTANDNLFRLVVGNPLMLATLLTEDEIGVEFAGQEISINSGFDTLLTINNGQCYAMNFSNPGLGDALLIQHNNNDTILHLQQNPSLDFSKNFYFHVDSTAVGVDEHHSQAQIKNIEYFDVLGRKQKAKVFSKLHKGIYIEIKHYDNGYFEQRKIFKLE